MSNAPINETPVRLVHRIGREPVLNLPAADSNDVSGQGTNDIHPELRDYGLASRCGVVGGRQRPKTLVDTGAPVEAVRAARDLPTEHVATLGECLETHGVAIGEIDTVILTHLHYDHIGFLPLFKHARVYVQKSELDAAYRPHPLQKNIYNTDLLEGVNFEAISGEAEIVEGVSVFPVLGS